MAYIIVQKNDEIFTLKLSVFHFLYYGKLKLQQKDLILLFLRYC